MKRKEMVTFGEIGRWCDSVWRLYRWSGKVPQAFIREFKEKRESLYEVLYKEHDLDPSSSIGMMSIIRPTDAVRPKTKRAFLALARWVDEMIFK